MKQSSQTKDNKSSRQSEDEEILVECQTEYGKGTSCKVDGKEVEGGLAEVAEEARKISKERGVRAYFQNNSLKVFSTMEEFLKSCPRLAEEMKAEEKTKWIRILAALVAGVVIIVYLWLTI